MMIRYLKYLTLIAANVLPCVAFGLSDAEFRTILLSEHSSKKFKEVLEGKSSEEKVFVQNKLREILLRGPAELPIYGPPKVAYLGALEAAGSLISPEEAEILLPSLKSQDKDVVSSAYITLLEYDHPIAYSIMVDQIEEEFEALKYGVLGKTELSEEQKALLAPRGMGLYFATKGLFQSPSLDDRKKAAHYYHEFLQTFKGRDDLSLDQFKDEFGEAARAALLEGHQPVDESANDAGGNTVSQTSSEVASIDSPKAKGGDVETGDSTSRQTVVLAAVVSTMCVFLLGLWLWLRKRRS